VSSLMQDLLFLSLCLFPKEVKPYHCTSKSMKDLHITTLCSIIPQ
jgi:hypothetical protein